MVIVALRAIVVGLVVAAVVALCLWLNVPKSIPLIAQGASMQRRPADVDLEFVGLDPGVSHVPVELYYFPLTPIFGITSHYVNVIAPLQIDTINRTIEVPVRAGHVRFSVPLGLFGLSNYRLRSIWVGGDDAPYRLKMAAPEDPSRAPRDVDIPAIAVREGDYRFDGALALFRLTASGDPDPYVYSPRVDDVDAPILWEGLRTLRARIDLAPYPVGSFVARNWEGGAGWKNLGYELTHPHATLTDSTLTLVRDAAVPLPFARQCEVPHEYALVPRSHIPSWSRIDGLWRPVARTNWEAFVRGAGNSPDVSVRFVPATSGRPSLEREEFFEIRGRTAGAYRLFAACGDSHYDSVAVTWLDVDVKSAANRP